MKNNPFKSRTVFLPVLILSIVVSIFYYCYDLIADVMTLFDETVTLAEDYYEFILGGVINIAAALTALVLIWFGSAKNNRRLILAAAGVLLAGSVLTMIFGGVYGLSIFCIITCLFAYWQMRDEEIELVALALTALYAVMFFFTLTNLSMYYGFGSSEEDMETIVNYPYIVAVALFLASAVLMFWNGKKSNWKGIKLGAFLYLVGIAFELIGGIAEADDVSISIIPLLVMGIFMYPQTYLTFYVLLKKMPEPPKIPIVQEKE